MWKSLCVAFIFVYFIPSSDATDCSFCSLSQYFTNRDNTKNLESFHPQGYEFNLIKLLILGSPILSSTGLGKVTINSLNIQLSAIALTSTDPLTAVITHILRFSVNATVKTGTIELATIIGSLDVFVTVAYFKGTGFEFVAVQKGGAGQLTVTLLNDVSYGLGGRCGFTEAFILKFLDQIDKKKYDEFLQLLNGDLKEGCSNGIGQCTPPGNSGTPPSNGNPPNDPPKNNPPKDGNTATK